MKRKNDWVIKSTLLTFGVGMVVGFSSNVASSESGIVIATMVILFLLIFSALMDGLGVAVASSKPDVIRRMKISDAKVQNFAVKLSANAERVNNICNDVIGDVCSVLNGACGAEIVLEIMKFIPSDFMLLVSVTVSSLLAALTVGSKAIIKPMAINRANEFVVYSAKVIVKVSSLFKRKKKIKKIKRH